MFGFRGLSLCEIQSDETRHVVCVSCHARHEPASAILDQLPNCDRGSNSISYFYSPLLLLSAISPPLLLPPLRPLPPSPMHSISDLTTFCRKTSGDVPAKLVVSASFSSFHSRLSRPRVPGCVYHRCWFENVSICEPFPLPSPVALLTLPSGWASGYRTTHGFRPLYL